MGIACISLTAPGLAISQAIVPACTPAKAYAPSSPHPHTWAPGPLELSVQMQETGDFCIKQTHPVQTLSLQNPIVNLMSTQAPALPVTSNSCSPPEILNSSVNTTSKGIPGAASCLNHHPQFSFPAFSASSAVICGGRHLVARHSGGSINT